MVRLDCCRPYTFFAGRQRKTDKLRRLQTIVTRSSVARCRSRSSELARSATNEASSHRRKTPVGRPELEQRRTQEDVPEGEPIGLTMGWLKFPYVKQGVFSSGPVALEVHAGD